jgi:hypothetical protein
MLKLGAVNRAEAARALGITRTTLAGWERAGVVEVSRDERGVPRYVQAEIDRLAALIRSGQLAPHAASVRPADVVTPDEIVDETADVASASGVPPVDVEPENETVRRIRIETAIARAERERLLAEIELQQARAMRNEVARLANEEHRRRRVEEVVEQVLVTLSGAEQEPVEQVLRRRLLCIADIDDRASIEALVTSSVAQARTELAARRASAERAAQQHAVAEEQRRQAAAQRAAADAQRAADLARASVERDRRVYEIVAALTHELSGFPQHVVAHASRAVADQMAHLADAHLTGTVWPAHVARTIAAAAIGMPAPPPPAVWRLETGWRPAGPGD